MMISKGNGTTSSTKKQLLRSNLFDFFLNHIKIYSVQNLRYVYSILGNNYKSFGIPIAHSLDLKSVLVQITFSTILFVFNENTEEDWI